MKVVKIEQKNWGKGLEKLKDAYELFGPVREKEFYRFKSLKKGELPDLTFLNTRLSPKDIIFPQSEDILEYTLDENEPDHHVMKEIKKDHSKRAIIGLRPCDAKSMGLVRLNFDTREYKDPYWLNAFENTTFIGLACDDPAATCFCTTAGCGPFHEEGLDVLMIKDKNDFIAKVMTPKGESFVNQAGWNTESDQGKTIESRKKAAEKKIESKIKTDHLSKLEILDLHGAPFWEDVSFACVNCGTCTYLCPTCWCFDIQDQVHGKKGKRMKNWDSCMFPLFSLHTSGHNPRDTKLKRVRQRFMHKLKYFLDKYDSGIMCVGCGRCVRHCPVNIDIRRVCDLMNSHEPADACAIQN